MARAKSKPEKPERSSRALRVLAWLGLAIAALGVLSWIAVHRFEWAGPLVAGTLRAVIGTDNVARLEDTVYGVEDRVNRVMRRSEAPKSYWQVPQKAPEPASSAPRPAPDQPAPFHPADVGPMFKAWSAPGDGQWVPINDPRRPNEPPYMCKTLLHPDPNRSWAELFVVAVDLTRTRVELMAGTREPKSSERAAQTYSRVAHVPDGEQEELLAAFNGGFMTEHGHYGMKVDGVVLVKARENACTIAAYDGGALRIASWKALKDTEADMRWYRQAPACMYENGKIHPGLEVGSSAHWGATLDGETVIRRSAVGLNRTRDVLFVAISNHTSARAIATGLFHAGASDIAQLDVNWSYPKFVLFERKPKDGPERKAVPLAPGFEFSEDEYIRKRSQRDFFYLVREPDATKSTN